MFIPDPQPSGKGSSPAVAPAGSAVAEALGMTTDYDELLPLVDTTILQELEDQLDGSELALGFARDYAALWDHRFGRLAAAVNAEDRPASLDAVISLRITSAMVGGIRLSVLAQALEDAIRRSDFISGQALLAGVADHGLRTVSELQANYILRSD